MEVLVFNKTHQLSWRVLWCSSISPGDFRHNVLQYITAASSPTLPKLLQYYVSCAIHTATLNSLWLNQHTPTVINKTKFRIKFCTDRSILSVIQLRISFLQVECRFYLRGLSFHDKLCIQCLTIKRIERDKLLVNLSPTSVTWCGSDTGHVASGCLSHRFTGYLDHNQLLSCQSLR